MVSFPVLSTKVNKVIFWIKFLFQASKVEFSGWPSHLFSYGFKKLFRQKELYVSQAPQVTFKPPPPHQKLLLHFQYLY